MRCDGRTPSCGKCVAGKAECIYAPSRQFRGPAKSKKKADANKKLNGASAEGTTAANVFLLQLPNTTGLPVLEDLVVYGKYLET
ncbi:hypothetical protein BR93DRAFT_924679 [Coniochaeta sp. PMI_546]|nr:hypothetical protein BR93DRAFT_924679 [Coniochaeta sp. PMI_546]